MGEDPLNNSWVIFYDASEGAMYAKISRYFAYQQLADAVAAGEVAAKPAEKIAKIEIAIMECFLGAFSVIPPLVALGGVLLKSYHYRREINAGIATLRMAFTIKKRLEEKHPSVHDYVMGRVAIDFWANIISAMSVEDYAYIIGRWVGAFSAFRLGLKTMVLAVGSGLLPIFVKIATSAPENLQAIGVELAADMVERAPEVCSTEVCVETADAIVGDLVSDEQLRKDIEVLAEKLQDLEAFEKVLENFNV